MPDPAQKTVVPNARRPARFTLFRSIRFTRLKMETPDRESVRFWESVYEIDFASECMEFAKALIDHRISDRKMIRELAEAFCAGTPINPDVLAGREREVAISFYQDLEEIDELPCLEGAYQAALVHAERVNVAKAIAEAASPRRGSPGNSIGQIVEDFLIVIVRVAQSRSIPLRVPSSEVAAESDTELTNFAAQCFNACQQYIHRRADSSRLHKHEAELITGTLNDIIGRPLSDRLRRIIKEFG